MVSKYAAIAKSTSRLASDSIEATDKGINLAAIVKHAHFQFQKMSSIRAGSIQATPRHGSVVVLLHQLAALVPPRRWIETLKKIWLLELPRIEGLSVASRHQKAECTCRFALPSYNS